MVASCDDENEAIYPERISRGRNRRQNIHKKYTPRKIYFIRIKCTIKNNGFIGYLKESSFFHIFRKLFRLRECCRVSSIVSLAVALSTRAVTKTRIVPGPLTTAVRNSWELAALECTRTSIININISRRFVDVVSQTARAVGDTYVSIRRYHLVTEGRTGAQ